MVDVAVNIMVKDSTPSRLPIVSAVVSILNPVTYAVIAQATTDIDGMAGFMLPGGDPEIEYEVRAYKMGVLFQPSTIEVPEENSQYDMTGVVTTLPVSVDPRTCRCTGRFIGLNNRPLAGVSVRVFPCMEPFARNPKVVDGNVVSSTALDLQTDGDGLVSVDLIRTGRYYVTFSGEEDTTWEILVPDQPSVNLIDLIHPQPVSLEWNQTDAPGNEVTVAVGEEKTVRYSVTFSNYEVLDTKVKQWLRMDNADNDVVGPALAEGILYITGVSTGTSEINTYPADNLLPLRVPTYSLDAPTLLVTVA